MKKYLVIITVSNEDTLRESAQEAVGEDNIQSMVQNELNWLAQSGLSAEIVREMSPDEKL